jgi:hypothetical protein
MSGYGSSNSDIMAAKIAYITANDDTSASESDRDATTPKQKKPPQQPRAYRLWSHEVNEEVRIVRLPLSSGH